MPYDLEWLPAGLRGIVNSFDVTTVSSLSTCGHRVSAFVDGSFLFAKG